MSLTQVKRCLDILTEYPAIKNYIINFNERPGGFSYTIEKDATKAQLQQQMNTLLDDGSHSGASWSFMLRYIQAILNGTVPYEDFLEDLNNENKKIMLN
uniref:Uncharacterized protein n=1 Tax=viral metagenome TaxID=1070528 RepID=A0A6C0HGI8_9ZZZZ